MLRRLPRPRPQTPPAPPPSPASKNSDDDFEIVEAENLSSDTEHTDDDEVVTLDMPPVMEEGEFNIEEEPDFIEAKLLPDAQGSLASSAQILDAISKQMDETLNEILADLKKEVTKVSPLVQKVMINAVANNFQKLAVDHANELLTRVDEFQLKNSSAYHASLIVRGFSSKHSPVAIKLAKDLFKPEDYVANPGETGFRMKKKK